MADERSRTPLPVRRYRHAQHRCAHAALSEHGLSESVQAVSELAAVMRNHHATQHIEPSRPVAGSIVLPQRQTYGSSHTSH